MSIGKVDHHVQNYSAHFTVPIFGQTHISYQASDISPWYPIYHEINCCFTNFIVGNLWFSSVFPIMFGSQEAFPSTFPAFSPSPPSLALPSPRQTSAAPGSCRWAWRRWPHAPRGSAPGALDLALGPRTSVQNIWGNYKYYTMWAPPVIS